MENHINPIEFEDNRELSVLFQTDTLTASVASGQNLRWAPVVAGWTQEAEDMLPKSYTEISELITSGRSVLVFDRESEAVVGHVAFTFFYRDGKIEIGSLCTDRNFRGRGIATLAVQAALRYASLEFPNREIFAMANQFSLPIFTTKLGGIVTSCERVEQDVWEHCVQCPMHSGQTSGGSKPCVHTPVSLSHLIPLYHPDFNNQSI